MNLGDFFDPDVQLVNDTMRDNALAAALVKISRDSPRRVVEDTVTPALPAGWVAGSALLAVEYPIGEIPPVYIEAMVYQTPLGETLYAALADGTPARVTYSTPWAASSELSGPALEAFYCWAASVLCEQLATRFAQDTNSTISADSVMHESKSRNFAARAKALRARYYELLELADPDKRSLAPASTTVNLNRNDSRGRDWLTHSNRWR